MVLRPDELASEAQIERHKSFDEGLKKGGKAALSLAGSAAGVGLASRIAPLLSPYITTDIAIKGISKISPQLGNFLQKGLSQGLDIKDGFDFIKDKLEPKTEEKQEQPKENRNIIEKYSPNLHQYILDLIRKGSSPQEAGSKAKKNLDDKFQKVIKNIEKDYKSDWSSIVDSIYGQEAVVPSKAALQPQTQAQQQPQQTPQPQGNQSTGMQNLMSALQTAQQMRAKRKGT